MTTITNPCPNSNPNRTTYNNTSYVHNRTITLPTSHNNYIHRRLVSGNKHKKRTKRQQYLATKENIANNNITNLSSHKLTYYERSILSKGLTFVSSHLKPTYQEINNDILRFERKLQLHFFFHGKNKDRIQNTNKHKFESNPLFWPKKLNSHITQLGLDLKKSILLSFKYKNNLTKYEIKALYQLRNNKSITIKKGDKGAGIVVLDTNDYYNKVQDMLNDIDTYTPITQDNSKDIKSEADLHIQELFNKNLLNKKQLSYFKRFTPRCPTFYGIPKIHKPNTPLRPIVSQINGPTTKINELVDYYLHIAEKHIPFLFQDTTAFLNIIESHKDKITENTYFVTLDVTSLYTNIPHVEGATFVSEFYEETLAYWPSESGPPPVDRNTLYELILFILRNCTFQFDKHYYTQNFGTTMGAKFSVKFANIYMYILLRNFLQDYTDLIPPFIGRLVDDIFFFWDHTEDQLLYFYNQLNNYHDSIKFEIHYSNTEIQFLDTIVYKDSNTVHTKLYIKPTDKKQYLHFNSSHPFHIKKAIPYSQGIRYRRIISDDHELDTQLKNLQTRFEERKYPNSLIIKELDKVKQIQRANTLSYKSKEYKLEEFNNYLKDNIFLPFITTYYPSYYLKGNSNINTILRNTWSDFINKDNKIREIFGGTFPQIVFKRGHTVGRLLTSTRFQNNLDEVDWNLIQILSEMAHPDTTNNNNFRSVDLNTTMEYNNCPQITSCGSSKCKTCISITNTNYFISHTTKRKYFIDARMHCGSTHIIYLITCDKCSKQYVGESGRTLRDRLNNHRSDIVLKKQTAISIHFNEVSHTINNLKVLPIEIITDSNIRKSKEQWWITELGTKYPFGINYFPL